MAGDALHCPICRGNPFRLITLGNMPLSVLGLEKDPAKSLAGKTHPIDMWRCESCGHVFNLKYNPDFDQVATSGCTMYNRGGPWVDHMLWVADFVKVCADGGLVVEVGAGNGEFANLCNYENYIAYEPCDDAAECVKWVTTKKCYYTPEVELALHWPEVILMRHVLEHYENPVGWLERLSAECREQKKHPTLIIEVPNIEPCLRRLGLEDWVYEHPQHFTPGSLTELARTSGWYVDEMSTRYNDEVIVAALCPFTVNQVKCVKEDYDLVLDNISATRQNIIANGEQVVLWGGAGKGATIINLLSLPVGQAIVVDSDARKWGKCVPGTPHIILPPRDLAGLVRERDVIVTTSWRVKDIVEEIQRGGYDKVGDVFSFSCGQLVKYRGNDDG